MATFFGEYVPLDEKLLAGIIAVSTLLSFVTLPLWVLAISIYILVRTIGWVRSLKKGK